MNELTFAIMVLLQSMVLCFIILSTFYGSIRAYLTISWVTITIYLLIYWFGQMDYVQSSRAVTGYPLLDAVKWTSLLQGLLGVGLVIKALARKEDWVIPALVTLITLIPFTLTR